MLERLKLTLILTLLTSAAIHQSSDYRLYDTNRRQVVHMPSTKRVSVRSFDWSGSITYAGIGRARTQETADIVTSWLKGLDEASFEEIAAVLEDRGTRWLRTLGLPRRDRRHVFVLSGHHGGAAKAAVISNFMRWDGLDIGPPEDRLSTTFVVTRSRPRLIVAGVTAAVERPERALLVRLARDSPTQGVRIRAALAEVNRVAASREPNLISPDCLVATNDQFGGGSEHAVGRTPARPRIVFQGRDVMRLVESFVDDHFGNGKWSVKSTTFGSSNSSNAMHPACTPRLELESERYSVNLLPAPAGGRAYARAVNSAGVLVGSATAVRNGPELPCVWPEPGSIEFLPHLGGITGAANAINEDGVVAGTCELPDRRTRAVLWYAGRSNTDLGAGPGYSSEAKAISRTGVVVGSVGIDRNDRGQHQFRPAIWTPDHHWKAYFQTDGRWGTATSINDKGLAVGFLHTGRDASGCKFRIDGEVEELPMMPGAKSFWPIGITDDETVFGVVIGDRNDRSPVVVDPDGCMRRVRLAAGNEITAVSAGGDLAGNRATSTASVPWAWFAGEPEPIDLPRLAFHHHSVRSISGGRLLAGWASADNCSHALVWRRLN